MFLHSHKPHPFAATERLRQRLIAFFSLILPYYQQIAVGGCDGANGGGQPFAFKT
ncbi:hypothetical protein D3C71_1517030 [compost metagenome]